MRKRPAGIVLSSGVGGTGLSHRRTAPTALSLALALAQPAVPADEPALPPRTAASEQVVERERQRAVFLELLDEFAAPVENADAYIDRANDLFERMLSDPPAYAPFLAEELERDRRATFDFCAVALGRMPAAEADWGLRRAVARADEETGDFPRARKVTALWALGFHGQADALDLVDQGRHRVSEVTVHESMSLVEAVAFQTVPDSIPRVLRLIERFLADEERRWLVAYPLAALRRIADESVVPALLPLLEHDDAAVRREAARTLRTMETPEAVAALIAALADENLIVRQLAADSLAAIAPPARADAIAGRLAGEGDARVRDGLRRALAAARGPRALALLEAEWDRHEDVVERRSIAGAAGSIAHPRAVPLLSRALADADAVAASSAASALGHIGGQAALASLREAVPHASDLLLRALVRQLLSRRDTLAGPAVAERLFRIVHEPIVDPAIRTRVEFLAEAVVGLRHASSAPRLRQAIRVQTDPQLVARLEESARRLELLEALASDVERWSAAAADPDAGIRRLAVERLGEIGGTRAIAALEHRFAEADGPDRVEILRALAGTGSAAARPLLERVLLTPEFDGVAASRIREMAAWAARRVGGRAMFGLLRTAVERRNGRDATVTLYAALTGGAEAIPLLERQRRGQLRFLGWDRGRHQERLDTVLRSLRAGRSLAVFDRPPDDPLLVW